MEKRYWKNIYFYLKIKRCEGVNATYINSHYDESVSKEKEMNLSFQ